MKKAEVCRWLRKNKLNYIKLYGMGHWDIEFVVDDVGEEPGLRGEIQLSPEYEMATIVLYPWQLEDEADLEETVRHELEHLLTAPFLLFWQGAKSALSEDVAAVLQKSFEDTFELARCNIGRFRKNALREQFRPGPQQK